MRDLTRGRKRNRPLEKARSRTKRTETLRQIYPWVEENRARILPAGKISREAMRVLSEADIVEVQPQANRRIYKLRREPFQELESWLQSFRRLWEERFDRLDDYLLELQTTEQHISNRSEDNNV